MSILERYDEELKADVSIDAFTVHDVQLKLPAIKHKWVGRLMRHKLEISQLKKQRGKDKDEVMKRLREEADVRLSQTALNAVVDKHQDIEKMSNKINELQIVIEYLEKVEKILSSMTFDIRNLTEIMKLETQ
jgi:wobble nucleotide-excising tRNase